jgi:DNA-binding transcriptional regulator YiaG
MFHYVDSGLLNVWLSNGYKTINTPYGSATAIEDVAGLHRAIATELAKERKYLSGREFRFLRKELGVSQEMLGQWLGYADGQQIAKWEKVARVPKLQDGVLRQLYLESINEKNTQFTAILNRLQEIDASNHNNKLVFTESTKKGWVPKVA